MSVELISHTPEPERLVSAAAKLCYSSAGVTSIMEEQDDEKISGFIAMLMNMGHESPIEHISFTFGIEGISRSLLAQLTRHRIASYSVKSQRYVSENDFYFVTPPHIAALPHAKEIYQKAMEQDVQNYTALTALLYEKHYDALLKEGKDADVAKKTAEKMAIEDARYVLPNACETKLVVTMNARSLLNFFAHRCCERAQWEIQILADEMLRLVREKAPAIFAKAGPPCVSDKCHEGKMSCGKQAEKRQKYIGS